MRYFEDLTVGETATFGEYEVTEAEILEFAERYDPQPIHLDPEVAAEIHGGLIASGWHTTAMTMRMLVDNYLSELATSVAAGVEELRFPAPVRPGHVLSVRTELLDKEATSSDRGRIRPAVRTSNQHDETVLEYTAEVVLARRPE